MYFRFFHKLMRDAGLVNSDEDLLGGALACQGMVLLADAFYYTGEDGARHWSLLQKRLLNVMKNRIIKATDSAGHELTYAGMSKMSKSKITASTHKPWLS